MPPQTVNLEVRDPRLTEIIAPDAQMEPLATGFQFLEGPVWLPEQGALVFSDIPGDTMYRWDAAGGVTLFRHPSHKANGNTLDRQGRLLTCEHATSRVVRQEPDGSLTVLASHYRGLELNSPNDIVVKSDGAIYFTDPNFGRRPTRYGVPRPQQLSFQAVFRLDPATGALTPVADDFDQPNGLCFSLDETRLFVNDSPREHIRVFDVLPDGSLRGGAVWAEVRGTGPGVPDGMKLDAAGNLYCAGPGGIHIFAADATCLGVIRMPEQAANFCWGGESLCDLFVCASTTLYRVRREY
ncbi:MAG: SMP-30/gluconolactonase/LRE family protein [Anaerolineae bacterium]